MALRVPCSNHVAILILPIEAEGAPTSPKKQESGQAPLPDAIIAFARLLARQVGRECQPHNMNEEKTDGEFGQQLD